MNNSIWHKSFVWTQFIWQTIYLAHRTQSGDTTPGQSGNERVLHIPQISRAKTALSGRLMSYPRQSLVAGSFLFAEKQSVYSTAKPTGIFYLLNQASWGCPRDVMVKSLDGLVVGEFVLQSRYYVHFRENTLGKGMNPLILPAMG